jgi:lipopolysaccharide/colanic/teichoic acid biosynthesis glycosyltransferase
MSASLVDLPEPQAVFADILDYVAEEPLPDVPWLTRLNLDRPRRDMRCLDRRIRVAKRITDIAVSATMLSVLWPVMLLIAALVKLTSRGPVIFRQTRVGLNLRRGYHDRRQVPLGPPPETGERRVSLVDRRGNFTYGRHFTLYKFRTMRPDAEKGGARFAVHGDVRVTPLGRFLRKSRLDELPQLWNVLKGEMTLVGPRPERPEFIRELSSAIPNYLDRLGLKPGLTGVSQIVNGYDNDLESFRRKVAFDLLYLQNCCLRNDLKILFRTIGVVVSGKGV